MGRVSGKAAIMDSLSRVDVFDFNAVESYISAGAGKVWASYKACKLVGDVFVSTNWSIRKGDKIDSVKLPAVDKILARPNPQDSFDQLLYKWCFHMKLTGMCYWYKDRAAPNGTCSGLWALNPKRMKLYINKDKGVIGYGYWVNGTEIPFDTNDIIYWRRPHPDDDHTGMGDVEAASDLFTNFSAQQEFQKAFLKSGGSYSQILVYKNEVDDEAAWETMKAKWNAKYAGTSMAGKTAWLSGDWDSIKHGMSLRDMMHIEGMQMSVESIFAVHGIPFSLAGIRPAENMSSSRTEDIQFRKYTVLPDMNLFMDKFNSEFVQKFSPQHSFHFNLSGLENIKEIVDDHKELIANSGMTPNELREKVGLPKVADPAMDEFYIGTHLVPLKAVQLLAEQPQAGSGAEEDNNSRGRDDVGNRDEQLDKQIERILQMNIVNSAKKNS